MLRASERVHAYFRLVRGFGTETYKFVVGTLNYTLEVLVAAPSLSDVERDAVRWQLRQRLTDPTLYEQTLQVLPYIAQLAAANLLRLNDY